MTREQDRTVLVVDLDGSLLCTDVLHESLALLMARRPLHLLLLPFWLLHGRGYLKAKLGALAAIDVNVLPWRNRVLELIRDARERGRTVVLATASDGAVARRIADALGVFDAVIASDATINRKGRLKLDAIRAYCGARSFDYIGDAPSDRIIRKHARSAIVVGSPGSDRHLPSLRREGTCFEDEPVSRLRLVVRAARLHQWAKNGLLFVPALFAGTLWSWSVLGNLAMAFVAFGLVASAIYLVNDLMDLEDDRRHRSKSRRPFASGALDLRYGLLGAPVSALSAVLLLSFLPSSFSGALLSYVVLNVFYNTWLKKVVLLDVLTLASLYTLRMVAGAAVTETPLSEWLLAFSGFMFLSLALAKRGTELLYRSGPGPMLPGRRGYVAEDVRSVESLGTASGYLSVLVLALYIQSPEVAARYANAGVLWFVCPVVLFWISRIWLIVNRGQMHDDPVEFSLRDPVSWGCAAVVALCYGLALGPGVIGA